MKEFGNKMQSLFPEIPKKGESESTVKWDDLLKSKWTEQKKYKLQYLVGKAAEPVEMSGLKKEK